MSPYFKKDSLLIALDKRKYERYSYLAWLGYLGFRFTSHDYKKKRLKGLFFDLGVNYNFPLYFKHVVGYEGNEKKVRGKIHRFTDFRGFARIGWHPVQLSFEYRYVDFVKGDYPQVPRYFVGLSFFRSF